MPIIALHHMNKNIPLGRIIDLCRCILLKFWAFKIIFRQAFWVNNKHLTTILI